MIEFQNALEAFLTSEDRLFSRYLSVVANMATASVEARCLISETESAMRKPLAELERNSAVSQKKLDELEKDIQSMGNVIKRTESLVEAKIISYLQLFLTVKLPEHWKSHSGSRT